MYNVFGDLHIHIGEAQGHPVKVTASRKLRLKELIFNYAPAKGLNVIGVVDAGSTLVLGELEQMLDSGLLQEHHNGGFIAQNGILLISGCEVESREGIHLLAYFPRLKNLKNWQKYMRTRIHNLSLSTQKAAAGIEDIIDFTLSNEGIFCPAHAFTPYKGIYGAWTERIMPRLGQKGRLIKVLELGLSADTDMADMIAETHQFTFLSNSDAHSAGNVGREYNLFHIAEKSFQDIEYCLEEKQGRKVLGNYGLDPRLGKYHRSFCPACSNLAAGEQPVWQCPVCGSRNIVTGVYDRILQIRDYEMPRHPSGRPNYYYRIPLKDIPGVGPATLKRLLDCAASEIELMENTPIELIAEAAGNNTAQTIKAMRTQRLNISPGGGGKYGKILKNNCQH